MAILRFTVSRTRGFIRSGIVRLACVLFGVCLLFPAVSSHAGDKPFQLVHFENFENGSHLWHPTDPNAWKLKTQDGNTIQSLVVKVSDYKPPHRSPHNISLLTDINVSDFELTLRLRSTSKPYGHQSLCLFFGFQNPSHFYYVHFGKKKDNHANQVFIVSDAPRSKISLETTEGTPWDDQWHTVRVRRNTSSGEILIYFDDLDSPIMRAVDKTFTWGQIGIGSFDDPGDFDDIILLGLPVEK